MSNYLDLTNIILREINEATITTVVGHTGFHKFVVDTVNKAIRDIDSVFVEWPYNEVEASQQTTAGVNDYDLASDYRKADIESFMLVPSNLVANGTFATTITSWTDASTGTGSSTHTTDGNGRLRLAGGASGVGKAYQALATVAGTQYRVHVRSLSGNVDFKIGTTIGGSELHSETLTIGNLGDGEYFSLNFTATGILSYISFEHAVNANYDIDTVSVFEDRQPVKLKVVSLDEWRTRYQESEVLQDPTTYGVPRRIVLTSNDQFRLSPRPDKSTYSIEYIYWKSPTAMTIDGDTHSIPIRFEDVIVARVKYYVQILRSEHEAAGMTKRDYKDGVDSMRRELINENDYLYPR